MAASSANHAVKAPATLFRLVSQSSRPFSIFLFVPNQPVSAGIKVMGEILESSSNETRSPFERRSGDLHGN